MLTQTALAAFKNFVIDSIAYAKFKVGNTYYQTQIQSASVMPDGRVAILFLVDHTITGNITITEVQLYDHSNQLWASKAESISRKATQEGVLYRFVFTIAET